MTPGTNSALYVAGASAVVILSVALGVRAISPPSAKSAAASSHAPFFSVGRGAPPGAPSAGSPYRVEEAVPIMVGGKTGLAVRFSGAGLDAAGKEAAAFDIFKRMKDDAEGADVQILVISYGANLPGPDQKPSPEDSFLFMRQADGTWARLRTDAPAAGADSGGVDFPVPPPAASAQPPK